MHKLLKYHAEYLKEIQGEREGTLGMFHMPGQSHTCINSYTLTSLPNFQVNSGTTGHLFKIIQAKTLVYTGFVPNPGSKALQDTIANRRYEWEENEVMTILPVAVEGTKRSEKQFREACEMGLEG